MQYIELEIEVNIGEETQRLVKKYVQIKYNSDKEFDQIINTYLIENSAIWGYSKLFGFSVLKKKPTKCIINLIKEDI